MAENRVEANAHNAGGCPASNAIHGHINDFLVRTGLRSGVSELQLPCFTAVRAEIALMSGSAFAVTHHPVSSGAGRTSDGNGSHASTLKSPSYTKSVSWQHYPLCLLQFIVSLMIENRYEHNLTSSLFWIIWFPVIFWMLSLATTLVSFTRVMLMPKKQRARWVSPDRGILRG